MNFRTNILIAFCATLFILTGCEKADSDADFGVTNIYMPQATMAGGYYYVPKGNDSSTHNFIIDRQANNLNIILGTSRSGTQSASAYSVNIAADADTVANLISNGMLDPSVTVLLPSSDYTLPTELQVPDGQTSATFFLSVNIDKLKTYAGKKPAIAVKITTPSKYTLLEALSTTIIVIDVDALNL